MLAAALSGRLTAEIAGWSVVVGVAVDCDSVCTSTETGRLTARCTPVVVRGIATRVTVVDDDGTVSAGRSACRRARSAALIAPPPLEDAALVWLDVADCCCVVGGTDRDRDVGLNEIAVVSVVAASSLMGRTRGVTGIAALSLVVVFGLRGARGLITSGISPVTAARSGCVSVWAAARRRRGASTA